MLPIAAVKVDKRLEHLRVVAEAVVVPQVQMAPEQTVVQALIAPLKAVEGVVVQMAARLVKMLLCLASKQDQVGTTGLGQAAGLLELCQ
jgi:hypothetical protein